MPPSHALLSLPEGPGSEADLRRLARSHPAARLARHRSRSYSGSLALVAWHAGPLGVDLERVQPTDSDFAESICTPSELELFGGRIAEPGFAISLWASKEALAKALGDAVAYDPRRLESPLGWSDGVCGPWQALEFSPAAEHVAWLVWTSGAQNSSDSALSADSTRLLAGRR